MINGWSLVNPENPKVPHPTAVIVDGDGTVIYFRQDVNYKNRPSPDELLAALAKIE